ncbi:MAG: UDP-N-acetylmuramoyl-L-alanine--D-glutamate ligase [Clostridiales bacterium]|nr:UDP-N-acetylmuramoyl-L-alanine--D-glutamate ligase [Clostridiales bacterium]
MQFENKNILVIGLARSGVAAAKALFQMNANVSVTDIKNEDTLKSLADEIRPYVKELILGRHPDILGTYDLAVISPGIPLDIPFVKQIEANKIPIIGELELAYRLTDAKFVGITGTNGKTTTTALTGEMFRNSGKNHYVVGNIGLAAVSKALEADKDSIFVTEVSSFQLETIVDFHCHISAILNLTPDHLNRHKTMENYAQTKARIFENQTESDWLILNFDDPITREMATDAKGNVAFFSLRQKPEQGAYIENGMIKTVIEGKVTKFCKVDDMLIFGKHNEENALAAVLMATLSGIEPVYIIETLKTFKGVEHRIEYVDTIDDRKFYNDSKATNPDSTICAINAMNIPTHLIAGGQFKGSDYSSIFEVFGEKIKSLILLGETKHTIEETAHKFNFTNTVIVNTMEEAVESAFENSSPGEAILLSPACASWDMYADFEKRGEHFKACVKALKDSRG